MEFTSSRSQVKVSVKLSFLEAVKGCKKDLKVDYHVRESKQRQPVKKSKVVTVEIPPGVDSGMTIRVPGQGNESPGKDAAGDLYVSISVSKDPYFTRNGNDVHVNLPLTLTQATLGASLDVMTLNGMVTLKIPQGSQPDSQLVIKGKGIKDVENAYITGNQYVHLLVKIPTDITAKQRELLEQFEVEEKNKVISGPKSIVDDAWKRLKDFMNVKPAAAATPKDSKEKDKK